ncbi:hypothetical protein [Rodentibacter myodis]|uniref:Uncharacterized protein n=1 Tax=Rodentibacter myodis TaxID=1907939 RepID=A0A1V3JL76_9PAST|nr:hypothetical protein [Rodentibacter myodis]OOF56972.1 hypothetical protein BKL49_10200 [Rodentibacter myodis]
MNIGDFVSLFKISILNYFSFFEKIDNKNDEIRNALQKFNQEDIDKLVILVAKQNLQAINLYNKNDYKLFFDLVSATLTMIDEKKVILPCKRRQLIQMVIDSLPNNMKWLISIYCLQQGEQNSLTLLWKKYASFISLAGLSKYALEELAAMPNDGYEEEKMSTEADKVFYMDKLKNLGDRLSLFLGVKVNI